MKILGNRILVRNLPEKILSDGGISLLPGHDDNRMQYVIQQVGTGRRLKDGTILPIEAKPGDHCIAHNFQGTEFDHGTGEKILNMSEVLAIIPK